MRDLSHIHDKKLSVIFVEDDGSEHGNWTLLTGIAKWQDPRLVVHRGMDFPEFPIPDATLAGIWANRVVGRSTTAAAPSNRRDMVRPPGEGAVTLYQSGRVCGRMNLRRKAPGYPGAGATKRGGTPRAAGERNPLPPRTQRVMRGA